MLASGRITGDNAIAASTPPRSSLSLSLSIVDRAPGITQMRGVGRGCTHLSARPCPTRYPSASSRKYVDSRSSSSSGVVSCVARSLARRSAMGTSSMRRKSKQEELRARALGSEMDSEAEASKDILWRAWRVRRKKRWRWRWNWNWSWSWRCEGGFS